MMMKNSIAIAVAAVTLSLALAGCDHLRSSEASTERNATKPQAAAAPSGGSTQPMSDRYATGGNSH